MPGRRWNSGFARDEARGYCPLRAGAPVESRHPTQPRFATRRGLARAVKHSLGGVSPGAWPRGGRETVLRKERLGWALRKARAPCVRRGGGGRETVPEGGKGVGGRPAQEEQGVEGLLEARVAGHSGQGWQPGEAVGGGGGSSTVLRASGLPESALPEGVQVSHAAQKGPPRRGLRSAHLPGFPGTTLSVGLWTRVPVVLSVPGPGPPLP